jgi:hypothetical protein
MLSKFLEWYKSKRKQPSLANLANINMPSNSGEKQKGKATRRRKGAANKKRKETLPVVVSRVVPKIPERPKPAFGTFAFAKLNFLDPKVSKCYGCGEGLKPGGAIPNPPEDLVVVTKAFRKYYQDGKQQASPTPSLVYYHINPNCISVHHVAYIPGLCVKLTKQQ